MTMNKTDHDRIVERILARHNEEVSRLERTIANLAQDKRNLEFQLEDCRADLAETKRELAAVVNLLSAR